eukprot:jgi/Mesen1/1248/ME000129S00354
MAWDIVELSTIPSRHEFASKFENANLPVVVRGAVEDWPALKAWTPASTGIHYLQDLAGHASVQVMASDKGGAFYGAIGSHERMGGTFGDVLEIARQNLTASRSATCHPQEEEEAVIDAPLPTSQASADLMAPGYASWPAGQAEQRGQVAVAERRGQLASIEKQGQVAVTVGKMKQAGEVRVANGGEGEEGGSPRSASSSPQLYLAQAPIFERESSQVAPLRSLMQDIATPAFVDGVRVASINLWMSVNGSRSSAHYDPLHNLLCVVQGTKRVRVWDPSAARVLYPMPLHGEASNHSAVDFVAPDLDRFPLYAAARHLSREVTLRAGDALFLPEGWWHQVDSAGVSMAVNFWWPSAFGASLGTHMDAYYARRVLASLVDSEKERMLAAIQPYSWPPSGAEAEAEAGSGAEENKQSSSPGASAAVKSSPRAAAVAGRNLHAAGARARTRSRRKRRGGGVEEQQQQDEKGREARTGETPVQQCVAEGGRGGVKAAGSRRKGSGDGMAGARPSRGGDSPGEEGAALLLTHPRQVAVAAAAAMPAAAGAAPEEEEDKEVEEQKEQEQEGQKEQQEAEEEEERGRRRAAAVSALTEKEAALLRVLVLHAAQPWCGGGTSSSSSGRAAGVEGALGYRDHVPAGAPHRGGGGSLQRQHEQPEEQLRRRGQKKVRWRSRKAHVQGEDVWEGQPDGGVRAEQQQQAGGGGRGDGGAAEGHLLRASLMGGMTGGGGVNSLARMDAEEEGKEEYVDKEGEKAEEEQEEQEEEEDEVAQALVALSPAELRRVLLAMAVRASCPPLVLWPSFAFSFRQWGGDKRVARAAG